MLGVFAEFDTNLRRERQLECIANAKAAGVYSGRPASIDVTKVREMKSRGMGASGQERPPCPALSCPLSPGADIAAEWQWRYAR
jgi:hypothetical protein